MNLFSKKTIKELFDKYEAKPLKKLGQNFLIDKRIVSKIIETAELNKDEIILEIGPGIGTLTQEISKKVHSGKVVAVEKDPKMVEILKETLKEFNNYNIIQENILKLNIKSLALKPYKVIANLPFYLTAPVIRQFLESENPPKEMILIIQKEVAQQICSKPPKMSILTISVQFYAQVKIIKYISKESFWPQPKVNAAIIKIIPFTEKIKNYNVDLFFKIVKAGFAHPRKQLINNLAKKLKIDKNETKEWLLENKIEPTQRAETLTVENWTNLTKNYKIKL